MKKHSVKQRRTPELLVAPIWVVLGALFVLPLGLMLLISFARSDSTGGFISITSAAELGRHVRSGAFLANYRRSFDLRYLLIFWRSILIAVTTTLLCALVSFPVAFYIAVAAPARLKNLLLVLAVIPFWTSFLIRTYAWMMILRTEGFVNTLLLHLGLIHAPLELLYNNFSVTLGLVYGELPFMILPLYASLEKLDRSLLEAAGDLGATGWSALVRVTLPLCAPGLAAGTVLVFIPSVGQFIVSDLLGGAKSMLVGNLVQNQFAGTAGTIGDRPFGAAVAFELTALVLAMVYAYAAWNRRRAQELLL